MGEVIHLSGQRIGRLHLTPIAPQRWILVDPESDRHVGLLITAGTGNAARCTAYRRGYSDPSDVYHPSGCWQAVCPAHLAPSGPTAFPMALAMLRRSIADLTPPSGILMK